MESCLPGPSVEKGFSSPEKTWLKTFREHPTKPKEPGQGLGLGLSSLFPPWEGAGRGQGPAGAYEQQAVARGKGTP